VTPAAKKAPAKKAPATRSTQAPVLVRATETFSAVVDDDVYLVHEGDTVSSAHAVVQGREDLFELAELRANIE